MLMVVNLEASLCVCIKDDPAPGLFLVCSEQRTHVDLTVIISLFPLIYQIRYT